MKTELLHVPGSGMGIVPEIYIGGAHKGETYVLVDHGWTKSFSHDYNADCINRIFQRIDEEYFEDSEKRGFDLKKAIYDVMREIWKNKTQYSYEKCYYCFNHGEKVNEDCYADTECDYEEYISAYYPRKKFSHNIANYCTFPSLKEFDLRREGFVSLTCKIKNIQNPVLDGKTYSQNLIVYDDNTNKTIKATFNNECADFDKWQKGDTIRLIGALNNNFKRPLSIKHAVKINLEEPVMITTNRESEHPGYNEWRESIIKRDQVCQCCGFDKHLEAHHLFGYKENPELAVNHSNGVTLCKFCHDKYHSVYGLKDINPVDFVDFIKRFGVR